MKMTRAILLCTLLLAGCTPRGRVPEPVPDHGPPAASAQLRSVVISWDVYIRDSSGGETKVTTAAKLAVILTCTMGGNARVKGPDGNYVRFPWGDTVILPYDFRIYTNPGVILLLKCTGTLVSPRPGYRFACESRVSNPGGADHIADQNSNLVSENRIVRPVSCLVSAVE